MNEAQGEQQRPNWVLRICLAAPLVPILLFLGIRTCVDHRDRQGPWLPAKLELSEVYLTQGEDGILSYCGTSVYGLSASSVEAIGKDGLAFFKDADMPRDPGIPTQYAWAETPVPDDRGVAALECAPAIEADLGPDVRRALKAPGSYWTRSGDHALYVLPSLELVVSSHRD